MIEINTNVNAYKMEVQFEMTLGEDIQLYWKLVLHGCLFAI